MGGLQAGIPSVPSRRLFQQYYISDFTGGSWPTEWLRLRTELISPSASARCPVSASRTRVLCTCVPQIVLIVTLYVCCMHAVRGRVMCNTDQELCAPPVRSMDSSGRQRQGKVSHCKTTVYAQHKDNVVQRSGERPTAACGLTEQDGNTLRWRSQINGDPHARAQLAIDTQVVQGHLGQQLPRSRRSHPSDQRCGSFSHPHAWPHGCVHTTVEQCSHTIVLPFRLEVLA
jgi:hypothetical protein